MPKNDKVNTLFSYFTKTPTGKKSETKPALNYVSGLNKESVAPTKNVTRKLTLNNKSTKESLARSKSTNSKRKISSLESEIHSKKAKQDCCYLALDLVWAKLDTYPWWPALICNHPTEDLFFKDNKIHVQFFDDPVSRAWIKVKYLKEFSGPNHIDVPKCKDSKWKHGVEEAVKALALPKEERRQLIVCIQSNDGESEMETDGESDASEVESTVKSSTDSSPQNDINSKRNQKRKQIVMSSDDSEDEFKPGNESSSDSEYDEVVSDISEKSASEDESNVEDSPVKTTRGSSLQGQPKSRSKRSSSRKSAKPDNAKKCNNLIKPSSPKDTTKQKLAAFASSDCTPSKPQVAASDHVWAHLRLNWLKDGNLKDISGYSQLHPDYNPRTLYIPEDYKRNLTPALKQWWDIKAFHFDTVLFFKVGKFYEMYHMDAVIGVNELGLIYMKGDFAHSGFPEIAYPKYSSSLIDKGYKVARVEQTETPQMMEGRCKQMVKPTKFDKVVKREICRITSKGTRTFSILEGEAADVSSNYLLALTEKFHEGIGSESEYGVCFIDTSIGKFHIGQFLDDRNCSRLRTLIAHYPPVQVLYEKGSTSAKTQQVLSSCCTSSLKDALRPGHEFWDSSKTLKCLIEGRYFVMEENKENGIQWPEAIRLLIDENDPLHHTAKDDGDLAVKSLGACIWYLKECCIEDELLTLRNFETYAPIDSKAERPSIQASYSFNTRHMVLDGMTLRNLEVLENSISGTSEGTLMETMDFCSTIFGKRLFRQWLCAPLCNPSAISDRLDAVEDLQKIPDILEEVKSYLKKMPDLERLLSKIHTIGSLRRNNNHPDSRAVFYNDETYSKRKINDFILTLDGFKSSCQVIKAFQKVDSFRSSLLSNTVTLNSDGGYFPDLKEPLDFFENAFDHEKAKKNGKIIPSKGVDDEYDIAVNNIAEVKQELEDYLKTQNKLFGCKVVYFSGSFRGKYLLEVPEHASRYATDKHEVQSQKKGFKRYSTPELKQLLSKLTAAEDSRDVALKDIMRRIFETFDKSYKMWDSAVSCMAVVDTLISFAQYIQSCDGPMCRPEILISSENTKPFLKITNGRHPALLKCFTGDNFIPNNTIICASEQNESSDAEKQPSKLSSLVLVTGPNMGGKSTLMRQTGLITIMAHIGSYVPAEECTMTQVDRVFTRLGASDRITEGESTFFVEVSETSSILQHASSHSLVLLDELGRGTSTYDGTAIACAVVQELATSIKCRTLFSTHYHCLVDEFSSHPNISLGHMACMVENQNDGDPTQEDITFLYKFVDGACPKSYGFNAARLAGIPDEVIKHGYQKARAMENIVESTKLFRLLNSCKTVPLLQRVQQQIPL